MTKKLKEACCGSNNVCITGAPLTTVVNALSPYIDDDVKFAIYDGRCVEVLSEQYPGPAVLIIPEQYAERVRLLVDLEKNDFHLWILREHASKSDVEAFSKFCNYHIKFVEDRIVGIVARKCGDVN